MNDRQLAKHGGQCNGYGHKIAQLPEILGRMLRLESQGFETLTPQLIGGNAKLIHFSPQCTDCQMMAYREMRRRIESA